MAWREWVWGLIAALAQAGVTVVSALMAFAACPSGWELTKLAIFPMLLAFLLYLKEHKP